jgi:hypothetical protein
MGANALSIDPANPQVIVAAVSDGVIRSADGGETWRSADGLPAKRRVEPVARSNRSDVRERLGRLFAPVP